MTGRKHAADVTLSRPVREVAVALAASALCGVIAAGVAAGPTRGSTRQAHGDAAPTAWPHLATAGPFLLANIHDKVEGRWGRAWRSLHPLDKLVAGRAEYVRCEKSTSFSAPLDSIRVVRVRRSIVERAGLAHAVRGVAVTVHVELEWYGPRDPIVLVHTFHLVPVHGRWTWLLSPDRYHLYRNDDCGGTPERTTASQS